MAGQNLSYQPNEFGVSIAPESTIGTAETTTVRLHVDSVSLPSINPIQDLAPKSNSFVAQDDFVYHTTKGTPLEVTFGGLLNSTALSMLEGILHTAASTNLITVTDSYTAPVLSHGESSAAATRTYTVKIVSPQTFDDDGSSNAANNTLTLKGACITAFSISGDASGDGRLTYSATVKSGYHAEFPSAAGSLSGPLTADIQNIHDLTYRKIAGVTAPVMQSFTLSIENPAEYIGYDPVNTRPYSISRSVPEGPVVTLSSVVKLDQDTKGILGHILNAGTVNNLVNHLSNNSSYAIANATIFSFDSDKAIVTGVSFNEQAAMMYSVEQKILFGTFKIRNS